MPVLPHAQLQSHESGCVNGILITFNEKVHGFSIATVSYLDEVIQVDIFIQCTYHRSFVEWFTRPFFPLPHFFYYVCKN